MECCWSLSLEKSRDHTASCPTVEIIRSTAFGIAQIGVTFTGSVKVVVALSSKMFMLNGFCGPWTVQQVLPGVTGHRSNTLDNQCGATITDSSASGASIPLSKRAEEGKQLETV